MTSEIYYFNENRTFTEEELNELKTYEILYFGDSFNQPIDNLPNNIKHITFVTDADSDSWSSFNYPIDNLPPCLESLELMSCEFKQSIDYLPISLKYLKLNIAKPFYQDNLFNNLPINLEHLCIYSNTNKYSGFYNFNEEYLFNLNNLPKNLKMLEIMPNTYKPIEHLPEGLETLIIYNKSYLNYPEQTFIKLPANLNMLVLNFSVNVNYKKIIEKMFNNKLTCKYLMLYYTDKNCFEHMKTISYIRYTFPTTKILCNDNYHMI
jgi:hypothetical protein